MKKRFSLICLLLVCLSLLQLVSCGKPDTDVMGLADYLQYYDDPERLAINAYEKAEFDDEIYYFIDRGAYFDGEGDSTWLFTVYYKDSKTYKQFFWLDMEYGLHTDVKEQWESRATKANSTYVFTADEIETLRKEAVDYVNSNK